VILPDANLLIGGFRKDSPHYRVCRPWLDQLIRSGVNFGIATVTLASVVRITTNRCAFADANTPAEALAYCDSLLSQDSCVRIEPGERHWPIFKKLCLSINVSSKLVTDAWLAALAIEQGCTFVTMDKDFALFPGLRWTFPVIA